MDLKQLRSFLIIAETGSMTRAAELMHLVQPALSRQLKALEEDLGSSLFERNRRGMQLTAAGQILVERARRALRELDQAKAEIVPTPGTVAGAVTIGILPSTSTLIAGPLVSSLKQKYPRLAVRICVGFAGHLQPWLENGEVDVALLYEPKPSAALEVQPLLDETLYLVGPPSAGLRRDRSVTLRDIASLPLILPNPPHGLCMLLEHACAVAGVRLSIATETNSMSTQKDLVEYGIGFTILPSVAIFEDVARGVLSAAPITAPDLSRRIVRALPMMRRSSLAVQCAASELSIQIKDIIDRGGWPGAKWLRT